MKNKDRQVLEKISREASLIAEFLIGADTNLENNRCARVLFCIDNGLIYLLHGFIKKTRETPLQDIELAMSRKGQLGV